MIKPEVGEFAAGYDTPNPASPEETPMTDFATEIWSFMRERKKYWMLPILLVMLLLGGLIVMTQGSALAPFIYSVF